MNETYRLPRTKHGLSTFEAIVQAAKLTFGEKGYHATTINDIVKQAEIAAGTFYLYFNDKLALYKYILNDYKSRIRKKIGAATHDAKDRYDMERKGISAFIKFVAEDSLSYNIIWESLFVDRTIFIDYYENFSKNYVKGLTKAYQNDEIRLTDFETLSYILMGISNFVGLQVMFKQIKSEEEISHLVDIVMDILEHGMFKR